METRQTKHTGGTWEARSRAMTDGALVVKTDREHDYREICCIREHTDRHYGAQDDEDQANADLIAASPELLRALIECVTEPGAACFQDDNRDMLVRRLRAINEIARAAIAKATT